MKIIAKFYNMNLAPAAQLVKVAEVCRRDPPAESSLASEIAFARANSEWLKRGVGYRVVTEAVTEGEITAKDGLLYRDGIQLNTYDADLAAQERGFVYAERLVRSLELGIKRGDVVTMGLNDCFGSTYQAEVLNIFKGGSLRVKDVATGEVRDSHELNVRSSKLKEIKYYGIS